LVTSSAAIVASFKGTLVRAAFGASNTGRWPVLVEFQSVGR
jgi:hypothetical protein